MSFALTHRLDEKRFEVFCIDCRSSIGTMDGETLRRAIIHPGSRGGVKCPDCRKNSCKRCGRLVRDDERGKVELCWWCRQEGESVKVVGSLEEIEDLAEKVHRLSDKSLLSSIPKVNNS